VDRSGNRSQGCKRGARLEAFQQVAEGHGAEARHLLLGVEQGRMTIGHAAASLNQRLERSRKLLERFVASAYSHSGDRAGAEHAALQLGEFKECGFDAVLDGANLMSDVQGGLLDDLPAHDLSFAQTSPGWAYVYVSKDEAWAV
jgi:hypothetical protein